MSESTVVSFTPFSIRETKPGLFPPEYYIPAAKDRTKPSLLVVKDGERSVFLDAERGSQKIIVESLTIARSIVYDFQEAQPGSEQNVAGPAIFFVPGKVALENLVKDCATQIEVALKEQQTWYKRLVRLADDTWTAAHKHSQISDLERMACRQLALKREWLDDSPDSIVGCPVCTTVISTAAIVCFACKAILKPEEYKKFQFAGASA